MVGPEQRETISLEQLSLVSGARGAANRIYYELREVISNPVLKEQLGNVERVIERVEGAGKKSLKDLKKCGFDLSAEEFVQELLPLLIAESNEGLEGRLTTAEGEGRDTTQFEELIKANNLLLGLILPSQETIS